MKFLSVCSGIEAASVAWEPLGWEAVAFSEIEKFPSAVLAHHWPDVPNLGDMTQYNEWKICSCMGISTSERLPKIGDSVWPLQRPVDRGARSPNGVDSNYTDKQYNGKRSCKCTTCKHPSIDLLVGGTPCQSFSVAGLRKGLQDPRGNLTLTFLAMAQKFKPRWVVWENVPGVLSDKTNAFGQFLAGLGELGYGFAYRVLDAQHFGVPQRRRRVFVVGCLGDYRSAAQVLFEPESLCGDLTPSREAREGSATSTPEGTRQCCFIDRAAYNQGINAQYNPIIREGGVSDALVARGPHAVLPAQNGTIPQAYRMAAFGEYSDDGTASAMKARDFKDATDLVTQAAPVSTPEGPGVGSLCARTVRSMSVQDAGQGHLIPQVANCLTARDHKGINPAKDIGTPIIQPIAFGWQNSSSQGESTSGFVTPTLDKRKTPAVAFQQNTRDEVRLMGGHGQIAGALAAEAGMKQQNYIKQSMQVRRLTPTECERLQGFPDQHTLIPWRNKPAEECPDGPRYKALGNSMAVPVMRWIGQRIASLHNVS